MGRRFKDKNFFRKKELEKKDFKRETNYKKTVADIIIACEDSVSSPQYFRCIVDQLIKDRKITHDSFVLANHNHTNPTGVLNDLKKHKNSNGKTYKDFAHKWIVIDRDSPMSDGGGHTARDFREALQCAQNLKSNLNIEVAYSNDSFELWYLLHFEYINSGILRNDILKKVIRKLKETDDSKFSQLDKNNIKSQKYTEIIYSTLLSRQGDAIKNAKKLLDGYKKHDPEKDNPSTKVHLLVEVLNELGKKDLEEL